MVTVFLRGGLGNQMFQYALGLRLAKKNGTGLVLDTVHLGDRFPRANFTYRTFDLDIFDIVPRTTAISKLQHALPVPGVWLGLDLLSMNVRQALGGSRVIYEKGDRFNADVLDERGDIVLFGRWESERYFFDAADDVRAAFRFRRPLEGKAKEIANEVRSCESVSLHVRRGDYVNFKNVEAAMGKTDTGYFERAIAHVAGRVPSPRFFVFSDDIAWCRANIRPPYQTVYLDEASAGPKAAFHLELMSLCKHHIIANSTFSWWGAWLDRNPKKIVVAPRRWKQDIVPAEWTML